MSNIAIITARGGSKRIPRKNIKEFCGKPILAYSIEAAINSGVFDEVMVSTDDTEIRDIALRYGANVPFLRSVAASNDYAMTHEVLLEVLGEYQQRNQKFDYMCCIYPTAPFVTTEKLKRGMEILEKDAVDAVLPVVQFSFPPQRGFVLVDGKLEFKYPENALVRSQDLEPIYHDVGQFYCVNIEQFYLQKKLIMGNTKPIVVDDMEAQDIDNESDWALAEAKFKLMK